MKKFLIAVISVITLFAVTLCGCSFFDTEEKVYVTSVDQSEKDGTSTIVINYSDGTSHKFTVGKGEDGARGENGQDGKDITIEEIYAKYVEEYGEISYNQFLAKYLKLEATASHIGECLNSVGKVYTEFIEPAYVRYDTALYTGSTVVWSMDKSENGYTYLVTNYHVVYDSKAESTRNGGTKLARRYSLYLYGSEDVPVETTKRDAYGYTVYDYGDYAIDCEYVGGSITCDIAVLRARTEDILEINPDTKPVTLAEDYYVGQTAIAVGNAEDAGLSVTQGIISVEDDLISLDIDGADRTYRSLRIDTALYEGNSGGGLFNEAGELIGINNAGAASNQNINYAIPLEIAKGITENIIYYATDGKSSTENGYKIQLGIKVGVEKTRYIYDSAKGYGKITENVVISSVTGGSLAADKFGLKAGDIIRSITVNDKTYEIDRYFDISDILLTVRPDDAVGIRYERDGVTNDAIGVTVSSSDLISIE